MLKRGDTTYRIQPGKNYDKVLITVWRNRKLIDHGVARVQTGHDFMDYFWFRGERFLVCEFH